MAKTFTTRAQSGQTFFGLPAFTGTPTATVNTVSKALTAKSSGVVLTAATAQDDIVAITFTPVAPHNPRRETFVPTTGQTIAPTKFCDYADVNPAATLAALTITFPPSPSKQGQEFHVKTSKILTAVTWTGGANLKAPATLAAGRVASFEWSVANEKWVFIH